MKDVWSVVRRVCAAVIGVVFFLSGILKLMDPTGAGLVVSGYFGFLHLGFLNPFSKALGVGLALVETALGAALLTGVFRTAAAFGTMVLTCFFTLVSVVLLVFNPEMDCGCFGEAIHLTHFQTFLKNVILLILCGFAFHPLKSIGEPRKRKYVSFGLVMAGALALTLHSLLNIPLVDFTPYKAGTELKSSLDNPAEAADDWVSTFIYEKNGREGSFTLDRLPDSTWTYVRTETYRRSGQEVDDGPVSLEVKDAEGNYVEEVLTEGNVFAISLAYPSKVGKKDWDRIKEFAAEASAAGYGVFLLAGSTPGEFAGICTEASVPEEIAAKALFADPKTLITLIRSNGGAVFFSDGMLVCKYPLRGLPSAKKLSKLSSKDPVNVMMSSLTKGRLRFQACLLYSFALFLLL